MSGQPSKTILSTATSPEVASLVQKIRNEIASKPVSLSSGTGFKLIVPGPVRPEQSLIDMLWKAAGSPAVCTLEEISGIARECCMSQFLAEDRRAGWLHSQLTKMLGQSHSRTIKASFYGGRLDQVIGARTEWMSAFESPCTRAMNQGESTPDEWDPFSTPEAFALRARFAVDTTHDPCSFISLVVEAKGMSVRAFDEVAEGFSKLAAMLFPLLEQTSDAFLSSTYQNAAQLREEAETFSQCIRLWLQPPSKKDQLKRRLRNALLLMMEAQGASHSAVRLALTCAAIEAIAVKKDKDVGIAQAFADNCAALLQPDSAKRFDTVRDIKKIYSGRSDLIHGNTIDEQPELADRTWLLAAGVIRAVMQWMHTHDLLAADLKDDDFFNALEVATRTATPVVGVSPRLDQCLPGGVL